MQTSACQSSEQIDAEVARLVSSGIRIPPQPKLVQEVVSMLQTNDLDLRVMADVIAQDAGLTAMLYKITRSAAFARRRPPQSVEQILVLVGVRQTAMLVQSYGLTAAFGSKSPMLEQFWARSGDIAQIASVVAYERVSVCNIFAEQAYMAGIFHDCGVPILMQRFPDYCKATGTNAPPSQWADAAAEDRAFQVDHCSIGYLLARHWRLPDFVANAILHHHDLAGLTAQASRSMVAVLQLAIQIYSEERGLSNPEWERIAKPVLEELGVYPADLHELCDTVLDMFHGLQAE
ncbi:HDOD domain-containing protein [Uliginosibacterium flavum]|uniref:HDOD domain-containing protein n=1 Tax=Uliginosibacterium flavum TaxID=1396831 RepID=A0ABV2TFQ7_9RHOO